MIAQLQKLIEALRNELQQYGEMLALLDQQPDMVTQRNSSALQQTVVEINAQSATIRLAREQRHTLQRELAGALQRPPSTSFVQLIPALPEPYRPLVRALVQENNELLHRVTQRGKQFQLRMRRSRQLKPDGLAPFALLELAVP